MVIRTRDDILHPESAMMPLQSMNSGTSFVAFAQRELVIVIVGRMLSTLIDTGDYGHAPATQHSASSRQPVTSPTASSGRSNAPTGPENRPVNFRSTGAVEYDVQSKRTPPPHPFHPSSITNPPTNNSLRKTYVGSASTASAGLSATSASSAVASLASSNRQPRRIMAYQPHWRHWPRPHCLISLSGLFDLSTNQLHQPHWLIDSSAVLRKSCHSRKRSNKNNMAAQASSSTRSCHLAIKRYRNCSLNLLFHRLVASHAFAREG